MTDKVRDTRIKKSIFMPASSLDAKTTALAYQKSCYTSQKINSACNNLDRCVVVESTDVEQPDLNPLLQSLVECKQA